MVVNNSSRINRRQAQENAARQRQQRANAYSQKYATSNVLNPMTGQYESYTYQGPARTMGYVNTGTAENPNYVFQQGKSSVLSGQQQQPYNYQQPTNTLGTGYTPTNFNSQGAYQNFRTNVTAPTQSDYDLIKRFEEARRQGRINTGGTMDGWYTNTVKNRYADPITYSEFAKHEVDKAYDRINSYNKNQEGRANDAAQSRYDASLQQTSELGDDLLNPYREATAPVDTSRFNQMEQNSIDAANNQYAIDEQYIQDEKTFAGNQFKQRSEYLEDSRARQEEFLKEQKDLMNEELEMNRTRDLERKTIQNNQQRKQIIRALNLTGGAASGNTNAYLIQQEGIMSDTINDIEKSYDLDRRKLALDFKADYLNIEESYDNKMLTALEDYNSIIRETNRMTATSKGNRESAIEKAKNNTLALIEQAEKDRLEATQKLSDKLYERMKDERDFNYKQSNDTKNKAYDIFTDAMTNSTDTAYRQFAADLMQDAGYNMEGVDIRSLSLEQQLKTLDIMKKQKELQGANPTRYEGDARQIMEGALGVAQKLGGSDDYKQHVISTIQRYVDEGNITGAREKLEKYAATSLNSEDAKQFNIMTISADSSAQLVKDLEYMVENGELRGKWVTGWNQLKSTVNASKDPRYINISSRIAAIASNELNRLSGAAISPEEYKRLTEFIPTSQDTVLDAKNKLVEFEKLMRTYRSQTLSRLTGLGDQYLSGSEPKRTYDNSYFDNMLFGNPSGGGGELSYESMGTVTQDFFTSIASKENGGLYDQKTVSAWGGKHVGLDVALEENTPIPSLVGGEIIEITDTPGWGKSVVIKDAMGGQHRLSHLNDFKVKKGDIISRGQIVGLSGNTGNSTGPHLDYRIKLNGKYVNPSSYQYS